jgi:hypothetical protein
MMIAGDGFMKNQGLAVNSNLTANLSAYNSSSLTVVYRSIAASANIMANLATTTVPSLPLPTWLTGIDPAAGNVTANIATTATNIAPDTKRFLAVLQSASSFVSTAVSWGATATAANGKGFSDFGLGVTKYSDMLSGGLSNIMKGKDGSAPDFPSLGTILTNFGTAYDPAKLQTMFVPEGFITGLQKQGLGNVGGLNTKLVAAGANPSDLSSTDPKILTQVLTTITGADAQKVVTQTKIVIPVGSTINTLADLLDANKVVPVDKVQKLPGGSLAGFGNALTNMGGSYKTCADVGASLSGVKVASVSSLDNLSNPLPPSITSTLKAGLGTGSSAAGTPTINDIIGTAGGYKHTDAFYTLVTNQAKILQTSQGQTLLTAATNLVASPDDTILANTFAVAQTAVINSTDLVLAKLVADSQTALASSVSHLGTEAANRTIAGMSIPATTIPNATQLLGMASKLHDFGIDKQGMGFGTLLNNMATNSAAGDAVRAALVEGQNIARSSAAGIVNTTKLDPAAELTKLQSR